MNRRFFVLLISLCVASAAIAHGDKVHVMGTIEKVSPEAITVKKADGKSVDVKLISTTMYVLNTGKTSEGTPAKFADLAVGQRVVIHATPKGTDLIADQVKFSAAIAGPSMKTPQPK